jgi:hypothetical protein
MSTGSWTYAMRRCVLERERWTYQAPATMTQAATRHRHTVRMLMLSRGPARGRL